MLVLADVSEAKELLALQHSAFAALYEIYHDQYNPAIESLEDFCSRFSRPNCRYYKIVDEKRTVGLIRATVAENANEGWIGLIGLAPSARKKVMQARLCWTWRGFILLSSAGFYAQFYKKKSWSLFMKS